MTTQKFFIENSVVVGQRRDSMIEHYNQLYSTENGEKCKYAIISPIVNKLYRRGITYMGMNQSATQVTEDIWLLHSKCDIMA